MKFIALNSYILITVHNLQLFGGPSGAFCTCALNSYTDIFSGISYVAFVDSGTYDPIESFEPWTSSIDAETEWDEEISGGNWDAFLAQTIGTMITGTKVDLIIRSVLPQGWTNTDLDTSLANTALGTDEWDDNGDSLAFSHNQLLFFSNATALIYTERSSAFFDSVDNRITGIPELGSSNIIGIYPNPVSERLTVKLRNDQFRSGTVDIFSLSGKLIRSRAFKEDEKEMVFETDHLTPGVYLVSILSGENRHTWKFIKL